MSTRAASAATRRFLADTGARVPLVCGPMYPGSNPELVAAVSDAGGFGVVQPIALTHMYGHDYRAGLRRIKELTDAPFGVNFTLVPNKAYMRRMEEWMDISIDEGVKFFLTSLGKPDDIVRRAEPHGIKARERARRRHHLGRCRRRRGRRITTAPSPRSLSCATRRSEPTALPARVPPARTPPPP